MSRLNLIKGSHVLLPVSSATGLPLDHINFLVGQVLALVFGYFFRTFGHSGVLPASIRHIIAACFGIGLAIFNFGAEEIFTQCGFLFITWLILRFTDPRKTAIFTTIMFMGYLSYLQLKTQFLSFNLTDIPMDVTNLVMIWVQKVGTLHFGLSDGCQSKNDVIKMSVLRKRGLVKISVGS